ncbi:MAG TPA: IS66 family transposase zinc-finger binding domain-containing protein [Candidatus Sulfotelmatobacter sp.]
MMTPSLTLGKRITRRPVAGSRCHVISNANVFCMIWRTRKRCHTCQQELRPIGEESSERYEYIPAQLTVIEDVCVKGI